MLEEAGIIERQVLNTRLPSVQYALTEKGLTIATLGQPRYSISSLQRRPVPLKPAVAILWEELTSIGRFLLAVGLHA